MLYDMPGGARQSAMAVDPAGGGRLIGGMAPTQAWRQAAQALMQGGMNMLLPPHCGACDTAVDMPGRLCADCWSKVGFIVAPYCARCGTPFEIEAENGALCAACMRTPPAYRRARAAILYRNVGRDLVLVLKMADRTWIAPALGGWMAGAGAELLRDADLIAPVPLHRWRLLSRRFNQSAMLAAAKAVRQTGGVTLLSWLSQKMIMWAARSTPASKVGSSKSCFSMPTISAGTRSISAVASAISRGVPRRAACVGSASARTARARSLTSPRATVSISCMSVMRSKIAGADRVARTT